MHRRGLLALGRSLVAAVQLLQLRNEDVAVMRRRSAMVKYGALKGGLVASDLGFLRIRLLAQTNLVVQASVFRARAYQ